MSKPLTDKVAVVTGGSRGIGRAIAEKLAAEGALVAVHYGKNGKAAAEVVATIESAGGRAFAVGADLSEKGAAAKLFAAVDKELTARTGSNKFDILINNAGIAPFVSFSDTTEVGARRDLYRQLQVAVLRDAGGREAAPRRRAHHQHLDGRGTHAAAGGGRLLGAESPDRQPHQVAGGQLGPRAITVNAVAPGVIDTDMAAAFSRSEEGQAFAKSKQALKRIGQTEDVADVVGFLASLEARWVTGQVIEATGGSALTF